MFIKELMKLTDHLIQKLKDDPSWKFAWKDTYKKSNKILDKKVQSGELEIRIWMSTCSNGYETYLLVEDPKDGYSECIYSSEYPKLMELSELLTSKTLVQESLVAFYDKLTDIYKDSEINIENNK